MKKILAALAVTGVLASAASAQTSAGTTSGDEAAIRKLAEKYSAAWNSGDARQAALLFTQDGSFTEVTGETQSGRAAIESALKAEPFGTATTGATLSVGIDAVRFLGPNIAVASGTTRFSGGQQPGSGHHLAVLRKVGNEWKIAAVHAAITPPRQPAVATGSAAPRPMGTSGSANEEEALLSLEREWAAAMIAKDTTALERILADDFTETDPMGATHTKETTLADAKTPDLVFESFTPADIKIRVFGDTAVATGVSTIKGSYKGQDISGTYRYTDMFVKRDGRWQAVASQATAVADAPKK